jgi:hypothetical protein
VTTCLTCRGPLRLLVALSRRGTPHGHVPAEVVEDLEPGEHNFVFDYTVVYVCDACGHGDVRSFSHDCFQPPWEEEWDMEWSADISPEDVARLRDGLADCPAPTRFSCECAAHERLRESKPALAGTKILDGAPVPGPITRKTLGVRRSKAGLPEFGT